MTDGPHLRRRERDLYAAAREIREEDIPGVEQQRAELNAKFEDVHPVNVPDVYQQQYQALGQQLRELAGTADTYDHYADAWGDGESCLFVLEELNGDAYAATIDAVSAEAARQARQDGGLPEGYGKVKALEYGVVEKPDAAPADPGLWPAAVMNELFATLNDITAPSGVDLGNESLGSLDATPASESGESDTAATEPTQPPTMPTEPSSPE